MIVKIIEQRKQATLVEWRDGKGLQRATIPAVLITINALGEPEASYAELELGIPYGEPWELLQLGEVGAQAIANALREHGVWTAKDARANVNRVRAALQHAYGDDLKQVLDYTRNKV